MRISERSIEEVREKADIVEVAAEFTALRRQGTNFVGLCPYHSEKTPSFSVSPEKNFYYCFGCLGANERIWTSRGLIPIAAVETGDQVIGLDGRRESIVDKEVRSGPTLRVRTSAAKEGIELTPDHWCVLVSKEEASPVIASLDRKSVEGGEQMKLPNEFLDPNIEAKISVEHASDLRVGDFWLYPVVPDEDRSDSSLPGEHLIEGCAQAPGKTRTTELHLNARTAWLYGAWLARGSLCRGGVRWTIDSETLAASVVLILEEEFGEPTTKVSRPDETFEVTCSSKDLRALLGYWFGGEDKRLPIEALSWTPKCQTALIEGYVDLGGYSNEGLTKVDAVSEELSYGVFALCVQAQKVSSVNSVPDKDGVGQRDAHYTVALGNESPERFFARINGTTYLWSVVQEVEISQEDPTTVVDITTTGSHTFLTKMGITHNCQKGGDAIKLVMELKSFSFVEAVSHLADRLSVELEFEGRSPEEAKHTEQQTARRRSAYKALAAATAYYHKYLLKSPAAEEARRYLKKRGLQYSTIVEFRLGYAPPRRLSGFVRAAGKVGLGRGALEAAGLLSSRGGERFVDRVMFPISDKRGRIVGFGARSLGEAKPKYLNSPETDLFNKRSLLYGLPQVAEAMRREKSALVVEGYTDVLMLYQSGIKNAVATLGTATTPGHLKILGDYADKVYVLFDPDAAGEKAIERILNTEQVVITAATLKLDLRLLRLPEDPADWLLTHSPEEFSALLSGAVPVLEYSIRRIADRARGSDAIERSRAVPEMKALIQKIDDPVLYHEALRLATEALGVGPEVLEERRRTTVGPTLQTFAPPNALHQAGEELLALILTRPDLAARAMREGMRAPGLLDEPVVLEAEDFDYETQARIFTLLTEHAGEDPETILSDERTRPLLDEISALRALGERLYPSVASLRAAWFRLAALSCEKAKLLTDDFDEKSRLHAQMKRLSTAAAQANNLLES